MQQKQNPLVTLCVLALAGWLMFGDDGGCSLPSVIAPAKVDRVTYVHTPKASLPSGVLAGIAELNTKGITATNFPEDTTDGNGEVPDQYRVPLEAARKSGVPSLVVAAGDKVLRVIKNPTKKQEVLDAAGH